MHHPCTPGARHHYNASDFVEVVIVHCTFFRFCTNLCSQIKAQPCHRAMRCVRASAKAAHSGADPCDKTRLQCSMFEHHSQPLHLHYQYVSIASPWRLENGRSLHLKQSHLSARSLEPPVVLHR
jgi:hypothetical protein